MIKEEATEPAALVRPPAPFAKGLRSGPQLRMEERGSSHVV